MNNSFKPGGGAQTPSKIPPSRQMHLVNDGVVMEQSGNSGGTYENETIVDNSLKTGDMTIHAKKVIINQELKKWNTVPGQTPSPTTRVLDMASSSSVAGKQNSPPSNPAANTVGPTLSSGGLLIAASDLQIEHSQKENYWKWIPSRDDKQFAELLKVWFLHIEAAIKFNELLPDKMYAAYLIFKIASESLGLNSTQEASVYVGGEKKKKPVCVKPRAGGMLNRDIGLPVQRSDGWMELELGQFYCDGGRGDTEVVMKFVETSDNNEKRGLIVAGIEIRSI